MRCLPDAPHLWDAGKKSWQIFNQNNYWFIIKAIRKTLFRNFVLGVLHFLGSRHAFSPTVSCSRHSLQWYFNKKRKKSNKQNPFSRLLSSSRHSSEAPARTNLWRRLRPSSGPSRSRTFNCKWCYMSTSSLLRSIGGRNKSRKWVIMNSLGAPDGAKPDWIGSKWKLPLHCVILALNHSERRSEDLFLPVAPSNFNSLAQAGPPKKRGVTFKSNQTATRWFLAGFLAASASSREMELLIQFSVDCRIGTINRHEGAYFFMAFIMLARDWRWRYDTKVIIWGDFNILSVSEILHWENKIRMDRTSTQSC